MNSNRTSPIRLLVAAVVLLTAAAATASEWGGHHGTIYLSFDAGPDVRSVADMEAIEGAGVLVDVHAVLTDLDPILYGGERVLGVGGFELKLAVEGADDARIVGQEVSIKHFDVAEGPEACMVGLFPDLPLVTGSATLVTWQVLIPGEPRPVRFVLDPSGVVSDRSMSDAAVSGSYALWSGSMQLAQHGLLFSSSFVPAYLNWEGDADLTPVSGKGSWRDTGLFTMSD